ncbi:MAG TPA: cellulose synthase operon protein YhjQ/BcsQ [Bryobacteraceae bacterium]|nr:cellulose synthase operon protein YhjQ/BcsQ [Bryobacteraceae bacterium]
MRGILISPNEPERKQFEAAIQPYEDFALSKTLSYYPTAEAASHLVRGWAPDVIVLSMAEPAPAEAISAQITAEFPKIQQIAIHTSQEATIFKRVLRLRMRELLVSPFDPAELRRALDELSEHLRAQPAEIALTDRFFAFVPAKAGVGASTIAANVVWALSKAPQMRVLLADFDVHSGVVGFMFNQSHEYSISDAAARSGKLDTESWQRLVKKVGGIDLLLSGAPQCGEGLQTRQVVQVLEFARRNYPVICADVPDALDETSTAVLKEANRVFLVTTPELPALRLAKLKASLLKNLELEDKTSLLVNRFSKRTELTLPQIQETVGLPVFASFPCDYMDVTEATRQGRAASRLAGGFKHFAEKLLNKKIAAPKRSGLVERLAGAQLRYSFR